MDQTALADYYVSFNPLGALLVATVGYLLGSIPFGLIFTRLAGLGDIRAIGSGNIGATNVLRTGRKGLAATTLLADAAKGAAAVLLFTSVVSASADVGAATPGLVRDLALSEGLLAGFAAFIGHLYPVWLRFKGGKGVATYLGVLCAAAPLFFAVFAGVWLAVAFLTRYSSAAALAAAAVAPMGLAAMGRPLEAAVFAAMSALIYWKHRANIGRLMRGEEPKIGARANS
ncbi:MAG: glycerol-3-phosphate 1-O-acyltransferase PlsY [Hyphomicrobiales bacterium]|nr:glycerol-3-phosphate 1-O-acyltransferase PlsY [Hyphomicrobiales bacterium]